MAALSCFATGPMAGSTWSIVAPTETSAGSIRKGTIRPGARLLAEDTMEIDELLTPDSVIPRLRATSKKQALQELSKRAAEVSGLSERQIFDVLLERERLGTTGVGNGIAIPHGKLPGLSRLYGLFARLEHPVDFDSIDEQPVDLIFLLLAPEAAGADHLKALARVSRLLRDADVARKLRDSRDADALYAVLAMPSASAA